MRKDDEIHGATGTSYDFGARLYDPRVGRWLSLDPLASKYAGVSPYAFAANNPVLLVDPNGREIQIGFIDQGGKPQVIVYTAGMAANTGNTFVDDAINSMNALHSQSKSAASVIDAAIATGHIVQLQYTSSITEDLYDPTAVDGDGMQTGVLQWNPVSGSDMSTPNPKTGITAQAPAVTLPHELHHFVKHAELLDAVKRGDPGAEEALRQFLWDEKMPDGGYVDEDGPGGAVEIETNVANDLGMGTRPNYYEIPKRLEMSDPMSTTPDNSKEKVKKLKREAKEGAGTKP